MPIRKRRRAKFSPELRQKQTVFLSIIRLLLAVVFVFSGFVKLIDPLGFTYKTEDYMNAFGGLLSSVTIIALPLAIILSALELVIGLNFLFKVKLRLTSFVALAFMLVMLPLTLYISIYNPVSDCGCFGDALVISNWATFGKNIAITILIILLLIYNKQLRPFFVARVEWLATSVFFLIGVALSVYCYRNLPLIDFLPYKVGVNIPEAMTVPEGAPSDEYVTTFIYEKAGQQKEFTLENYPKGDSTWVFVDQKSVLISEGYKAPIHDFTIVNEQFEDITEDVLYDEGRTHLLLMYDLSKTSIIGAEAAERLYQNALANGEKFYALTASTDNEVQEFIRKTGVNYPFCKTDPITLKTIVRSNPGLIVIQKGTIVEKSHWREF